MSLLARLKVDLDKVNVNEIEESAKNGGLPAPGYHHARLEGVREFQGKEHSGIELRFKIISGPARGTEVKDALWPQSENEKSKNRILMFMHRLGMLTKTEISGQIQYQPVPGKTELYHVSGANAVDVFLDIKHEPYKSADGKTGMQAALSFEGVLSFDDKRCEKCPRDGKSAGTVIPSSAAAAGQSGKSSSQPASVQQSFDDI